MNDIYAVLIRFIIEQYNSLIIYMYIKQFF